MRKLLKYQVEKEKESAPLAPITRGLEKIQIFEALPHKQCNPTNIFQHFLYLC
jgi:hypothetical protein